MRFLCSTFLNAAAIALGVCGSTEAWAQGCCAGSGAVTPARLASHEDGLVGVQLRATRLLGSFNDGGAVSSSPGGTSELALEENLFGAIRVLRRGQLALLAPVLQTRRRAGRLSALGGGSGDVNASARYDFVFAREEVYVPGIAVLVGLTFPTGTAPEAASRPLATDATGVGAFQGTLGLALEQSRGPWLVGVSALLAKRTSRSVQGVDTTLGAHGTLLVTTTYAFHGGAAVAALVSYGVEARAVVNGSDVEGSARRIPLLSLSWTLPLGEDWRIHQSLFLTPPLPGAGRNSPTNLGATFGVVRSWS